MNKKTIKIELFNMFILFFIINLLFFSLSYSGCGKNTWIYYDQFCTQPVQNLWDFDVGFDGCIEGIAAGQFYKLVFSATIPECYGPEAKWKDYPGNDGDICKVRWGLVCEQSFEGKYDASEGKCVSCEGRYQVKAVKCGYSDDTTKKCETACGADQQCDEIQGSISFSSNGICTFLGGYLNKPDGSVDSFIPHCKSVICDASKVCYSFDDIQTQSKLYCIYDKGFKWSSTLPSKETSCNDGYDNDCDGLTDQQDSDCKCVVSSLTSININPASTDKCGSTIPITVSVTYSADGNCQNQNIVVTDQNNNQICNITISTGSNIQGSCQGNYKVPDTGGDYYIYASYGPNKIGTTISVKCSENCTNGKDDDGDSKIDCADPDCAGKQGPNGVICCQNDNDCNDFAKNNCQGFAAKCINNICKCLKECTNTKTECYTGYCCANEIDKSRRDCVPKGTIINTGGKSYICDPPYYDISSTNKNLNITTEKITVLHKITNYLENLFLVILDYHQQTI